MDNEELIHDEMAESQKRDTSGGIGETVCDILELGVDVATAAGASIVDVGSAVVDGVGTVVSGIGDGIGAIAGGIGDILSGL